MTHAEIMGCGASANYPVYIVSSLILDGRLQDSTTLLQPLFMPEFHTALMITFVRSAMESGESLMNMAHLCGADLCVYSTRLACMSAQAGKLVARRSQTIDLQEPSLRCTAEMCALS